MAPAKGNVASSTEPDESASAMELLVVPKSMPTAFLADCLRCNQLPQYVGEDAAAAVVFGLLRRIDARDCIDCFHVSVELGLDVHWGLAARVDCCWNALHRKCFEAGQAEACVSLARWELERQHSHADQIRAVNTLETLCDDDLHAEE